MVAAAIVLSLGIGAPFEKDQEPQSAQWIQAVVQRGEWLLPRDDYGGIDRKPPLYYWLSALAVKAGGARVDEVSARFVALVAGVLLAVAVMRWSAAFLGEATGWLALAFVLGTYGFASRAALGLTDMLLSLLLFATWWCVYLLLEEGGSRAVSIAGGVLLGLAILTKGPVAIVLIGLAGLIYLLLVRRSPLEVLRRGWPWLMIALALAIGACWYVPAFAEGGRVVVGVFLSENFGHFMPSALGGTGEASRPLWYIAARMFGGALPQSLLVAALAIALWRRDGDERVRKPLLFQLSLVLAVLVFFSIASSKRDDYILPAMPGLAILFAALFTGAAIAPGRERSSSGRVRDLTAAVIAAASVALVAGALVMAHQPRLLAGVFRRTAIQRRQFSRTVSERDASSGGAVRDLRHRLDRRRAHRVCRAVCAPPAMVGRGTRGDCAFWFDAFYRYAQTRVRARAVDEDLRGAGASPHRRCAALHSVGPRLRVVLLLRPRHLGVSIRRARRFWLPTGRVRNTQRAIVLALRPADLRRCAAARAFANRAGASHPAETRDAIRPDRRRRPARAL